MFELVEFPNDRWGVRKLGWYHSSNNKRWYENADEVKRFCMMTKDDAETILAILQGQMNHD